MEGQSNKHIVEHTHFGHTLSMTMMATSSPLAILTTLAASASFQKSRELRMEGERGRGMGVEEIFVWEDRVIATSSGTWAPKPPFFNHFLRTFRRRRVRDEVTGSLVSRERVRVDVVGLDGSWIVKSVFVVRKVIPTQASV